MAKKPFMFGGKESAKEESAEKKLGKKAYLKGEKSEGEKNPKFPAKFKCGGKAKRYAEGGEVEGGQEYSGSVEDAMATAKARMAEKDAEYAAKYGSQESTPAPKAKPRVAKPSAPKASKLSKPDYDTFGKSATGLKRSDVSGDISVPRSRRFAAGGQVRGTGAASKGKKFSGVF